MNTASGPSDGDITVGIHCTIIKVNYILDEHGSPPIEPSRTSGP